MSSTKRGRQRNAADNYPTPAWTVDRLFESLPLPGGAWLEPSAGEGAIISAVNDLRSDVRWCAVELRGECLPALSSVRKISRTPICRDDFKSRSSTHLSPWRCNSSRR
jgi:hypothetical protein